MKIAVYKFGGTSVATEVLREDVLKKTVNLSKEGYKVVVVISAMGRVGDDYATDTLLNILKSGSKKPNKRELDAVFACGEIISGSLIATELNTLGYKSIFLTGFQAGIVTDSNFTNAKIIAVNTDKINKFLEENYIVVVAGGQGADKCLNLTSIGRGGSDTTATALAYFLKAEKVLIFSDVAGIMTYDPKKIESAHIIPKISYKSAITMAYKGSKVIHPKAVAFSEKDKNIKLYLASTFSEEIGTEIGDFEDIERDKAIGVSSQDRETLFTIENKKEYKNFLNDFFENAKEIHIEDYTVITEDKSSLSILALEICKDYLESLLKNKKIKYKKTENLSSVSLIFSGNSATKERFLSLIKEILKTIKMDYYFILENDNYIEVVVCCNNMFTLVEHIHKML